MVASDVDGSGEMGSSSSEAERSWLVDAEANADPEEFKGISLNGT